jgi:hypothetical protein
VTAAATAAGAVFKWCRVCDALQLTKFQCTNREFRMRHTWAVRPKAAHELSARVKRERPDAAADESAGAGAAGGSEAPAMRAVPAPVGVVKTEAAEEMEMEMGA